MAIYNINGRLICNDINFPSISLFNTMGIIGDSIAAGEIWQGNNYQDIYNLSWGKIIERISNVQTEIYAKSGLSTRTWLESNDYGLGKLNSTPAKQIYIICLGINDGNNSQAIGSISDIESDSSNTFYSYYGRIVRAIQNHAPNAIIMLSTCVRFSNTYLPYSNAIKNIGSYYNFPVLDVSQSYYFHSDFNTETLVHNHPNAVGYSGMAKEYIRLIEEALQNNPTLYNSYTG